MPLNHISRLFAGTGRSASMLEINYGIIATVAAAAVARCYLKFVRGAEPRSVNMKGKVCVCVCFRVFLQGVEIFAYLVTAGGDYL